MNRRPSIESLRRSGVRDGQAHKQPSARVIWLLAILGPVLVGGGGWLWEAITVTSAQCSEGSALGSALGPIGFFALLLAVPVAIAWYGRRARPLLPQILAPMIVSLLFAFPAIIVGTQIWWYAHNCYT